MLDSRHSFLLIRGVGVYGVNSEILLGWKSKLGILVNYII